MHEIFIDFHEELCIGYVDFHHMVTIGGEGDHPMPQWLCQALQRIQPLLPKDFAGKIQINVAPGGGIANVNVEQTYKFEDR